MFCLYLTIVMVCISRCLFCLLLFLFFVLFFFFKHKTAYEMCISDWSSDVCSSDLPKGLFVLFFAEMWERFSYYGMRALLIFYLVRHWLYSDEQASVIYGAYTALVYITPVVGGYLADRYLGQRKAVLFGAVILTMGHFLMAFEGDGGQDSLAINIFWLALSFIIVGSVFLKANISVIVGQLYHRTDPRRDPASTIFYMGINLGAALGAIIAGYLGQTWGWSWGLGE